MLLGSTRLDRDDDFLGFAADLRPALLRVAALLCGGDPLHAETAVRTALTRGYLAWPVTGRTGAPGQSVRVLVEAVRRSGRRGAFPALAAPVLPPLEHAVLTALSTLPLHTRAAVVLRRVERLPAAQVADVLGCAELTASREAALGVARLHEELADLLVAPAPARPAAVLDEVLRGTAAWLEVPAPDPATLQGDLDRGHRALVRSRRRRPDAGAPSPAAPGTRTAVLP
ncbi:sigma factor-like helix-turn-helix DNA-binding protein [Modestobacter sp. NPDC049651]|uniref:sigma factor-like helix-turn-helix DNA-binding protein n=1 Tax=unclassified Modestobacter TaxID=2643866 RepID=UPI0033E99657